MDWDLTSYFPQFLGAQYQGAMSELKERLTGLSQSVAKLEPLNPATAPSWALVIQDWEGVFARFSHFMSYIHCLVASDSRDEAVIAEEGQLTALGADFDKIVIRLKLALAEAAEADFQRLLAEPCMDNLAYPLSLLREEARYRMSPAEEELTAELAVDGFHAWNRLYQKLTGCLSFALSKPDGPTEMIPMSQRNSLLADPDRQVREAAFQSANAVFAREEHTLSTALNALAGTRLRLQKRRQEPHFLDPALRQAHCRRETLEAMWTAIDRHIEIPRSILLWKSQQEGRPGAAYYDLHAPLPQPQPRPIVWEEAVRLAGQALTASYPRLGAFLRRIVERRWLDFRPRASKRPGGFCTTSELTGESRIFMTYRDTLNDLLTLAHETGHAWHSHLLEDVRPLARQYPMTLAESASTFAELLLSDGVVNSPDFGRADKLALLDSQVGQGPVFLLDLPVRFRFEKRFYEERGLGEVGPTRLKQMMVEIQRAQFGPALLEGGEDPYFWASKQHFYFSEVAFYNFPYTFGYLLSLSLFTRFQAEGPSFLPAYEDFLRQTGLTSCEDLARRTLGEDISQPAFWERAILGLEVPFRRLRQEVEKDRSN